MSGRSLNITIAAENIPSIGAGLGYFLLRGIKQLAQVRPSWRFRIIASSSFIELNELRLPNMKVIFWDDTIPQRLAAKLLRRYFPDSHALGGKYLPQYASAASYFVSRFVPSNQLKSKFGDLKALYQLITDSDVVWVPHYAIVGGDRFSSLNNLERVRTPILFTIHDIHPVFFPDDWSADALDAFWNGFVPFAARCHRIVTHSQAQRSAIVEHLNIESDRIAVTHCPPLIETTEFEKSCSDIEKIQILKNHRISQPFALYPGSGGHTHKNHTRLLMAWSELKRKLGKKCPMLVCTAKGHLWPFLKALINVLEINDVIRFTDSVETSSLVKLYQTCAFVIVPTLYEGGGSGPVAEALLAGKPVVCSRIPQIEEQLQNYKFADIETPIAFFTPESIDSIVQATESTLAGLSELQVRADIATKQMFFLSSKLWEQWAIFYAEQMEAAARLYDSQATK